MRPGHFYLITSHGNKGSRGLQSEAMKKLLLTKIEKYLCPVATLHALTIANHYYLMVVRFKGEREIIEWAQIASVKEDEVTAKMQKLAREARPSETNIEARIIISTSFQRLGISFAKTYNGFVESEGHVVERVPKRILLKTEFQIRGAIVQTHLSCEHCGVSGGVSSGWLYESDDGVKRGGREGILNILMK